MKFDTRNSLFAAATMMLVGLKRHVVALNIVHVTVAALTAALKAARDAETLYQNTRACKRSSVVDQNNTRASIAAWCTCARDVLRPFLGNSWNESWAEAGFKSNTLSLPASLADLTELARSLREYFITHSNRQNQVVSVTSAVADQHFNSLDSAVATVAACKRDQRANREMRDLAEAGLIKLMRKLHSELGAVLEPEDVRWLDFEGEAPADESVPSAPGEVQVEADGPGSLDVEWVPAARADRYLVEVQEAGEGAVFRRVATVREPNATVGNLPPETRVKVRVVAVNGAGESVPSAVVEATVPPLAEVA